MPCLGQVISWSAPLLLVLALPMRLDAAEINDTFTNAARLSAATTVTASNVGASSEPGEPYHANEPPARSLWWRWTAPFTGSYSISTSNSTFDTVLAVYTGSNLSNLSAVASSDDYDTGILWSRVIFRAYLGETFLIAVDGVSGATGTVQLSVGPLTQYMGSWSAYKTDGGPIYSTNFAGAVLLLDFWETTCGPCVDELPDLSDMHKGLHARGFNLVGLAIDPLMKTIETFMFNHPVSYPIAQSNPGAEAAIGGTLGVPTKCLVDREGLIAGRFLGGHDLPFYENLVLPLLRTSSEVRVDIARVGNNVKISWPGTESGFEVQSIGTLPNAVWTRVDAPVESVNGRNVVTLAVGSETQLFRLHKP